MAITEPPPFRPHRRGSWYLLAAGLAAALAGLALSWFGAPRSVPDSEPAEVVSSPSAAVVAMPAADDRVVLFRDATAGSGVEFTYRNGEEAGHFAILESLGGGVALIDYDGDGLLDVFVTGGGYFTGPDKKTIKGHPCKLYRNLGNWKFKDVTAEVGLQRDWFYTHGAAVADYDRDGWPDLLVTGYGGLVLFHNEPDGTGGRRLVDVTDRVGLAGASWYTSAGWADLDGDGFPELYVCRYLDWSLANNSICPGMSPAVKQDICPPRRFRPLAHALFHNEKGKTFRDMSADFGIRATGAGLGVVLADLNDDGRPDIFVVNDGASHQLYFNRGGKGSDSALTAGVALGEKGQLMRSAGVDAGDYDGTGRPALWATGSQDESPALFRHLGRELFDPQSQAAGIAAVGTLDVGFGTGFVDVDNDGWEDLVIARGHRLRFPGGGSTRRQQPLLLRNTEFRGRRRFQDITSRCGPFFRTPALGRGLAIGDLDNDGWPDLVFSHLNSPVALVRNETGRAASANWLGVKLVGQGHRDITGSTIILENSSRRLTRFARGGGSYLSSHDPRILFGLGSDQQVRRVSVKWAWGKVQSWDNLLPNRYWELHEGVPEPREPGQPGQSTSKTPGIRHR